MKPIRKHVWCRSPLSWIIRVNGFNAVEISSMVRVILRMLRIELRRLTSLRAWAIFQWTVVGGRKSRTIVLFQLARREYTAGIS